MMLRASVRSRLKMLIIYTPWLNLYNGTNKYIFSHTIENHNSFCTSNCVTLYLTITRIVLSKNQVKVSLIK